MDKFLKWKKAFKSKDLKVNLGKTTKVMVSSGMTKDGMSKSKVDPCEVCSLRVNTNAVLCVQCCKWIHGRRAGVKRVTPNFTCRNFEGNIGEPVKQEETLCDEMETVREFTYLGDKVSAGGGCEAAVTARTRYGWAKSSEYGELLHGRKFSPKLKGAVHRTYLRPAILYGREARYLKECEMGILGRKERSMVRAMCGV